jgi:hypothetical protein
VRGLLLFDGRIILYVLENFSGSPAASRRRVSGRYDVAASSFFARSLALAPARSSA